MTARQTGLIIKNYNGYYYVSCMNKVIPCKIRGRMKKSRYSVLTGDMVMFSYSDGECEGLIEEVLPRRNHLDKPAVANIDQLVLVFAAKDPDFNHKILDRFLTAAARLTVPIIICLNKTDLLPDERERRQMLEPYAQIGYTVISTSIHDSDSLDSLKMLLNDKTTVFSGLSGAGKSSLLNALYADLSLATGATSAKNNKGRHTTRFSQLIPIGGGYVADTPGFTLAATDEMTERETEQAFGEFAVYRANCRFTACLHDAEPYCAVKEAVHKGLIASARYESYKELLAQARAHTQRRYK